MSTLRPAHRWHLVDARTCVLCREKGEHSVQFEAGKLASGVHVVQLRAGTFLEQSENAPREMTVTSVGAVTPACNGASDSLS